ncbi:MAG TPA: hypothetical protein PLC38_05125 [Methanobacterium sp.]|jgi:hypothetical protein|nr:hypothetical protein [Methanobacterium sp.]
MSETPSSESMSDISQSSTSDTDLQEIPKPILKIKSRDGDINIIGKYKGEVSIKPINLKFIMANLWWEKSPELETFFNVMELTIKRALREVYPHHKLSIDYRYCANDQLEEASEIVVQIDDLKADDTEVKVEGDSIILMGKDDRGFFKKITSFRRKVVEEVHKEI